MTVSIDPTARISHLADIEPSQRGTNVHIGAGSMIDSFVKIKPAGGAGDVVIGAHCYINSGCVLYSGHGIRIGDNVLIAANCTLAATNHAHDDPTRPIREQGFQPSRGGIVIEDDVWIGANCVLLDGAHVERGCVVAAGSVVRSRLAAFGVHAGVPARLLRHRGKPDAG
ncbi:MAG: acyltransferase [Tropicimonas sp.]|uniref:acyltransferase n=1 Tax=Tropicimonas sp. TaxID=2067044 RepID=UPI003A89D2BE